MRRTLAGLVAALGLAAAVAPAGAAADRPNVLAIHLTSEIDPVSAHFVSDSIDRAENDHDAALVIVLDTPGGLSTSMDDIIKDELNASLPIIVYVSPAGARAASAGAFITEAADVAAMNPSTNIGSSTPIDSSGGNIGSDLRRKILNDATAKMRALANAHGRNARLAETMVTKATNFTAEEAKKRNLIDDVSPSLDALLRTIDGRHLAYKDLTLHTAGANVEESGMPLTLKLLDLLIDPNLLYLLFLLGIVGIAWEIFHPGVILPGTIGAVSLVLALFGFSIVPISWAGVALIVFGMALIAAEGFVTSHGLIAVSGIVALVVGGLMLFPAQGEAGVSPILLVAIAAALGGTLAVVATKLVAVRRQPLSRYGSGAQGLVGERGVVRTSLRPRGQVFVHGELWQAEAAAGAVEAGTAVVVDGVTGLLLHVSPLAEPAPSPVEEPVGRTRA